MTGFLVFPVAEHLLLGPGLFAFGGGGACTVQQVVEFVEVVHQNVAFAFAHVAAHDTVGLQVHEHLGCGILVDIEFFHQESQVNDIYLDDRLGNIPERERLARVTAFFLHGGSGRLDIPLFRLALRVFELADQVLQRARGSFLLSVSCRFAFRPAVSATAMRGGQLALLLSLLQLLLDDGDDNRYGNEY